MSRFIKKLAISLGGFLAGTTSVAYAEGSFGDISENIVGSLSNLNEIFYKAFYILGVALIFGSFVQFRAYRNNPVEVRLSQPVFLLILGLVLFCTPLLVKLSMGGSILTGNP